MKTTVEIPKSLLEQANRLAAQEDTAVRALVEEGLRRIMAERKGAKPFKLCKVSSRGNGLQPAWPPPGSGFATRLTKGTAHVD